ncbi:MAG: hypothetical protein U0936_03880 [Planctomycetaceae bacterium]
MFVNNGPSLVHANDLTNNSESRAVLAIRCLAVFEIILITATLPLWWGDTAFPQVRLVVELPPVIDQIATVCLMMACTVIVSLSIRVRSQFLTSARGIALFCSVILVSSNQHRLQSWHWLMMLNLTWAILLPQKELLTAMRHTVAAVYICSALSRISLTPEQGISGIIVRQLLELAGQSGWERAPDQIAKLCHLMTLGEFLTGLLLIFPTTQRGGCLGAILLHCTLLLALGPLGLDHHAGVLLWNLCFLCLVPILFPLARLVQTDHQPYSRRQRIILAIVWMFPVSGLFGVADNWPSWQLYSSRPETWILSVREADRTLLPDNVQSFISEPAPLSEWCVIKLDRWSLAQTRSPMYPEDRFQRAVIESLLAKIPESVQFRIDISEPEFPCWWKRRERQIASREELRETR